MLIICLLMQCRQIPHWKAGLSHAHITQAADSSTDRSSHSPYSLIFRVSEARLTTGDGVQRCVRERTSQQLEVATFAGTYRAHYTMNAMNFIPPALLVLAISLLSTGDAFKVSRGRTSARQTTNDCQSPRPMYHLPELFRCTSPRTLPLAPTLRSLSVPHSRSLCLSPTFSSFPPGGALNTPHPSPSLPPSHYYPGRPRASPLPCPPAAPITRFPHSRLPSPLPDAPLSPVSCHAFPSLISRPFPSPAERSAATSTWLQRWQQRQQWHGHSHLISAGSLRPTRNHPPQKQPPADDTSVSESHSTSVYSQSQPQHQNADGTASFHASESPFTAWLQSHSGAATRGGGSGEGSAGQGGFSGGDAAGLRAGMGAGAGVSAHPAAAAANAEGVAVAVQGHDAAGTRRAAKPKASLASWLAKWNNYTRATISCSNSDVTWQVPLGTPWRPKWWPWNYTHAAHPQAGGSSQHGGMNVRLSAVGAERMRRWLASHGKLTGNRAWRRGSGAWSGKRVKSSNSIPKLGELMRGEIGGKRDREGEREGG